MNEDLSKLCWKYINGDGEGVPQDGEKAIEYFTRAEDWEAIGKMYRYGNSVERDPQKALEYFRRIKSLTVGVDILVTKDLSKLGWEYINGDGVEKNIAKALDYFNRAED